MLVPYDEADGGLEDPMEGVSQAEAVPDDEREIGGLELEMEGFVFKDPVADLLEGGQRRGSANGGVIGHGDDLGRDQNGDFEPEAQGSAEGAEDAVDPVLLEQRLGLVAQDFTEPAGVALFLGDQAGDGLGEVGIVDLAGEGPSEAEEVAAVGAFAELELAEGVGEEVALVACPLTLMDGIEFHWPAAGEVDAPEGAFCDRHVSTLHHKVLVIKSNDKNDSLLTTPRHVNF